MTNGRVVARGHAWRGVQSNVYGDRRYVCECGETGSPVASQEDARAEHRMHKRQVTTPHRYRRSMAPGVGRPCGECGLSRDASVHALPAS